MLAADADLQIGASLASPLGSQAYELPDALPVAHLERILLEQALLGATVPLRGGAGFAVVSVHGGATPAAVSEMLASQAPRWTACDPAEAANMAPQSVQLLLGPEGRLVQFRWMGDPDAPHGLQSCIQDNVAGWSIPSAAGPSRATNRVSASVMSA